jgi:hypothetical protein
MKRRIAVTVGSAALLLTALAASPPRQGTPLALGGIAGAQAAATKSLGGGGGGGDVSGIGGRVGDLLSTGAPALIALAGYLLLTALTSRNIGAGVGVVVITLVSLIFLLSPESIESLAKGIASTVF